MCAGPWGYCADRAPAVLTALVWVRYETLEFFRNRETRHLDARLQQRATTHQGTWRVRLAALCGLEPSGGCWHWPPDSPSLSNPLVIGASASARPLKRRSPLALSIIWRY